MASTSLMAATEIFRTSYSRSLLLALVTLLIFWPGLSGDFIFDDYPNIVTNDAVQLESLSWDGLNRATRGYEGGTYGRPLATLGFALDYLAGGGQAFAFKVHSLLLHITNALLIALLLRRLTQLPRAGAPWSNSLLMVIPLLWAIHPLQVSTVLYVVQRMEMLAVTFTILAMLAYLRGRVAQREGGRGWLWIAASVALTVIGMLGKETAILVPAYLFVLEIALLGFEAKNCRTQIVIRWTYGLGAALATTVFLFFLLPYYSSTEAYASRDFSLAERLLTQLRVLPMYLGQMVAPVPANLSFYYDDLPKSTGWLSPPTTLAGGIFLLLLVGVATLSRRKFPLVSLGLGWFFVGHLLTSNVINLELVFEHRNYFALFGVLLAAASAAQHVRTNQNERLLRIAVIALVAAFGALSLLRAATWGDRVHLALEMAENNPRSPRAASDLATLYVGMSKGNPSSRYFALGAAEFERASQLPGSSPLPEQGLILMAATTGLSAKQAWWDSLIQKVRTRPLGPQETMAVLGLLSRRMEGIPLDDAQLSIAMEQLLARGDIQPMFYVQYAQYALRYLGDKERATRYFVKAVENRHCDSGYASQLVIALRSDGRIEQALAVEVAAVRRGLLTVRTPHANALH